jgi:hypothetical protein
MVFPLLAEAHALPFADGYFDAIVSFRNRLATWRVYDRSCREVWMRIEDTKAHIGEARVQVLARMVMDVENLTCTRLK